MSKNKIWKKAIIALMCTVLVIACKDPNDPMSPPLVDGKGAISINFGGGNARTLLSSEIDITKLYYVLNFTQTDGTGNLNETQNGSGQLTLQLNIGTWNLVIRGYNSASDATDTTKALVSYTQNDIVISFGSNVPINAILLPNLDNLTQNGIGTLRYSITFPAGAVGVLKVYIHPVNTLVGSPVVLSATENRGSLELASGYYDISVSMEYQGKVKVWSNLAHINDNAITEAVVMPNDFTDYLPSPNPVDIYLSIDKFTITDEASGVFDGVPPIVLLKGADSSETIAADGLVVIAWQVGDAVLGTGNSLTLNAAFFPMGVYTLNLTFIKNNKPWLGNLVFEVTGTPGLAYELIDNGTAYRVREGTVTSGDVYIPPYYNGLPVTEIGSATDTTWTNGAFYRTSITSVYIPASITTIGNSAFQSCDNLTRVTFAEGGQLKTINGWAFSDCLSLTGIEIPEGVTSIYGDAFYNSRNLTNITIPASVTYINSYAFSSCYSLTNITVAANNPNYTSEGGILYNKAKTTLIKFPSASGAVSIPSGVITIGERAFLYCSNLTSITLPITVTSIGSDAFLNCINLTSINFPASLTSIDFRAFWETGLTSISIPASLTSIAESSFGGCRNLTSITVDANNPNYTSEDGILYNKAKTTLIQASPAGINGTVIIPASVTSIDQSAFMYCASLTGITLPVGITYISYQAFSHSGLTSITIPASVTFINSRAFNGCTSLTSVTFESIISAQNFSLGDTPTFPGDLRDKYLAPGGGIGTYTRPSNSSTEWTKL